MYNENVKIDYLNSLDNKIKKQDAKRIFNALESCEQIYDTDMYDIPFDILLQEVISKSNLSSFMTFRARYYTIKDYKKWALNNNLLQQHSKAYVYEQVDLKSIFLNYSKITIYYTPAELTNALLQKLTKRAEYETELSIDEIAMAYIMLIYQGFSPDEAMEITIDNIKITDQNIAIITNSKIAIVYPEFVDVITKVATCRKYYYKRANMQDVLPLNRYLIDNGRNASAKVRRQNMMVIYNMRGLHIKLKDIYYMGKLYDFYQHHSLDSSRVKILEYCFNGNKLSKTTREQFYRFIELWNN